MKLTIEDLAAFQFPDIAHGDLVSTLGAGARSKLLVVNGHALDLLDTQGAIGLLVLGRWRRPLLEVLCELNLLVGLGLAILSLLGFLLLLLLNGSGLTVVLLEFLLLLLAQRRLAVRLRLGVLGHQVVKASLIIGVSSTLVLSLCLNQLGSLLSFTFDLGNPGVLQVIKVIALLTVNAIKVNLILIRGEIIVIFFVLILIKRLTALISRDAVVAGEVDGMSTSRLEENVLTLRNGDIERLLAALYIDQQQNQ